MARQRVHEAELREATHAINRFMQFVGTPYPVGLRLASERFRNRVRSKSVALICLKRLSRGYMLRAGFSADQAQVVCEASLKRLADDLFALSDRLAQI